MLQTLINNIFRQDWSDHAVLGRTLFGGAMLIIGITSMVNASGYASVAPSYLPFPTALVVVAGAIFIVSGFFILAHTHVRQAAYILIALLTLFIVLVYLPISHLLRAVETAGLIGAAFLVSALTRRELEAQKETAIKEELSTSKKEGNGTA